MIHEVRAWLETRMCVNQHISVHMEQNQTYLFASAFHPFLKIVLLII